MSSQRWTHYNPVRIEFGAISGLTGLITADNILIVTTSGTVKRGTIEQIKTVLNAANITIWDGVTPNPELQDLDAATLQLSDSSFSYVIGVGGGSALDAAKILATTIPTKTKNCLEKLFRHGAKVELKPRLPLALIPTTAGTGSEVTPFATVWDREKGKKYSFAGPHVYPDFAFLDPQLTLTMKREDTLFTALDTVSHALESIWNYGATPLSKQYALSALKISTDNIPLIISDPRNITARSNLQEASVFAGLAISQTRTAIAHALSYPLTSRYGIPHGLACGFSLEAIIQAQIQDGLNKEHSEIMERMKEVLQELELKRELQKYTSLKNIENTIKGTNNPERLNNYKGNIDTTMTIIKKTLEC